MRITNRMLGNTVLHNLNTNLEMMKQYQNQMSSGKKISRPSDDPIATARVLALRSAIAEQDQHVKNMDDGIGWLDTSDSAMGSATASMQRVRELVVYGANGSLAPTDRQALAYEVDQLVDNLVQIANTSYGGRYIFGGFLTTQAPFRRTGDQVHYDGDQGELRWEVSPQVSITINTNGQQAFMTTGIFNTLLEVREALEEGQTQELGGQLLRTIDQQVDNLLDLRAVTGAKYNRLQLARTQAQDARINLMEVQSRLEDIDLAETVMQFKQQEYVYQAALATASKSLQPSLLDYLS